MFRSALLALLPLADAFSSAVGPSCLSFEEYYPYVTSGNCESNGYDDIYAQDVCTRVLSELFYGEVRFDMTITPDDATPPGCWPVDYQRLENPPFTKPTACLNTKGFNDGQTKSPAQCSEVIPCYCRVRDGTLCAEDAAIPELPYVRIEESTCYNKGYKDFIDSFECTKVLVDNHFEETAFLMTVTPGTATPPGCWPVLPGTPDSGAPFACVNPLTNPANPTNCSADIPCFCKTERI